MEELDGETVLYRQTLKKVIYLNDSASAVWSLCDGQRSVREIAHIFVEAYPEIGRAIELDIKEAIDRLTREGALRLDLEQARRRDG